MLRYKQILSIINQSLKSFSNDRFKVAFVVAALLIAAVSLLYSHKLTNQLLAGEKANMEVWAEAMRSLTTADETTDLNLVLKVINSNNTIPVIVIDSHNTILASRNLRPEPKGKDSLQTIQGIVKEMKRSGECIRMDLISNNETSPNHDYIYVYYQESYMLHRLTIYPYIQLAIVALFMVIAIIALLLSKKAEQNRVWVGLSRETAHQLGTPISSLMAWSEVLRESYPEDVLLPEMDKDVRRLQLIAERFSKIGSAPELEETDLCELISRVVEYISKRISQRVTIRVDFESKPLYSRVNPPLFEWVIENLCKNAVDAMEGVGSISIYTYVVGRSKHIEITDTGKGIPHNRFNKVFKPGFTTKQRGWGLGLSLAKRIVEEYHNGRIYVKRSEIGQGTTFAIEMTD